MKKPRGRLILQIRALYWRASGFPLYRRRPQPLLFSFVLDLMLESASSLLIFFWESTLNSFRVFT
jgi:hypothetical protein